ncbi:MAG: VWA domain-containing protein [Lentisphaerae bacterium]|nr:VWA domain-containing protein [Lentisphaerota bacterium]
MRFAYPLAALLLIPWLLAVWRLYRRSERAGILFAPIRRLPVHTAGWRVWASRMLPAVFLVGLACLIIAAARPQTFIARERRTVDAIAIAMTVDISGSMEALDLSPRSALGTVTEKTRLAVVKETFAAFIRQRPDDLLALITFGGYASTRSPLTADHRALLHVLNGVQVPSANMDDQGRPVAREELLTAIGDGLATACARLTDSEPKTRIIVLLSDGESNTGIITPDQAAEAAKKLGIRVYTIGVGSTGRAPFRTRDDFGRSVIGWGEVSLDETQLRSIASVTGARYFNVRDPEGLKTALDEIGRLETTRIDRQILMRYQEWFVWPLFVGATLVCAALTLGMLTLRRLL